MKAKGNLKFKLLIFNIIYYFIVNTSQFFREIKKQHVKILFLQLKHTYNGAFSCIFCILDHLKGL